MVEQKFENRDSHDHRVVSARSRAKREEALKANVEKALVEIFHDPSATFEAHIMSYALYAAICDKTVAEASRDMRKARKFLRILHKL